MLHAAEFACRMIDPQQVQHIRGLGFIGFMASGSHHQAHHLAMASEFVHSQ
jgi:hypothetical protein